MTWIQSLGVETYQKHHERFENTQQMNIMQDGFSYVFTFKQPYDRTYYAVHFYWHYYDAATGELYAYFLPAVNCSTDHYSQDILTRLENYNLGSGIICPDMSGYDVMIKLIGDRHGNTYSYMQSEVRQCQFESDCQSSEDMYNYLYYMEMRYITTNTYYDQSDLSQPVKTYLKLSPSMYYIAGYEATLEFTIAPSQINFLNGSISMVYELKDDKVHYLPLFGSVRMLFLTQATIDPYYVIYQEYIDYQPQFESVRRQLDGPRKVSSLLNISSIYKYCQIAMFCLKLSFQFTL